MNQFVLADASRCIGCHACEVACVMAHNGEQHVAAAADFHPRLQVIRHQALRTAALCRHCDEAPCAASCPSGAIIQRNGGVQVLLERCIGCKSCVLACPFGAMRMAPQAGSQRHVAHKCDLCEGREQGPACVAACPSEALQLMDDAALARLRRQRQQCSATGERPPPFNHKRDQLARTAPRCDPAKIPLNLRKTTFTELYPTYTAEQASQQGQRCLGCGDHSICEWRCPLHNRIPHWIELAREGRILEAVELSHQTNSLPEITGRICPQDRLCEGACTLKEESGSMTVGALERYITEQALALGWRPDLSYLQPTGKRVAIIGAGPAGLGCADILVRNGISPVVFDRHPEIGGLLTFGIPAFKLDKEVLSRRRKLLTEMGVEFRLGVEVGHDHLARLLREFDAVFVGVGTYSAMKGNLPNEEAPGVHAALPYLMASTRHLMQLPQPQDEPYLDLAGQQVVVLGGGDTAMDCVRTALRQGATRVTCAYRRDEANMPGSRKEVKNAREEGAEFEFNVQPVAIETDEQGAVCGIRMQRTRMGDPDAAGRRRPVVIEGSEFLMPADAVLIAFGFNPHPLPWLEAQRVRLDRWGRIATSQAAPFAFQTSNPQIFAGGDAVRGADLVVTAMAEGRQAAAGIMQYLGARPQRPEVTATGLSRQASHIGTTSASPT
ncbi:formate-dependent uric acid utilization protein AegA [Aeromonas veronii]|uniref:formate-dependent uric acid utilization protein AegA n=1 Tax=Aeromonas TaxID=642 RepID=UPI003DA450C8